MEPDQQFEIQLSHICNNRCVFCVSGQMTELRRAKPTPLQKVLTELDQAAAKGIKKATIMGGEPTIQAIFWPVWEHIANLPFEQVYLFTNGVRLVQERFIDRAIELVPHMVWRISLQGGDEETHDATTIKKGAFAKIRTGLEHLKARGQRITINMCVVEQNYRSLPALADLVARYPIEQVHLDMVRPRDSGDRTEDYLDSLMPDYQALSEVIKETLSRFEVVAPGLDVNIGNLPYCMAPEWGHLIHHGGNETFTVAAEGDGRISKPWNKYEDKKCDKSKLKSCESCVYETRCDGFFRLYEHRRGTEIFKPVTATRLREADPEQRVFIVQMVPGIAALRATPPAGWILDTLIEEEPNQRMTIRMAATTNGAALPNPDNADDATAWVRMVLRPAAAEGGGDGEHDAFCLRIDGAFGLDDDGVQQLSAAVFDVMSEAMPGDARHGVTASRIRERRLLWGPTSMVPPAVSKRVHRVVTTPDFAGWKLRHAGPTFEPMGARMSFEGGTDKAWLTLSTAKGGRVQVSWQWGEGHDDPAGVASRRAMATAVQQALKGKAIRMPMGARA